MPNPPVSVDSTLLNPRSRLCDHYRSQAFLPFCMAMGCLVVSGLEKRAWSEVTMKEVIHKVRAGEALVANREVSVRIEYRIHREPVKFTAEGMHEITAQKSKVSNVLQGNMFRLQVDQAGKDTENDNLKSMTRVRMYDGAISKARQGNMVNLAQGRTIDEFIIRPHMMIVQASSFAVPLSTFLSGRKAVLAYGGKDIIGKSTLIEAEYVGQEVVDNLACHKVVVQYVKQRTKRVSNTIEIWMAEDRNWLPIKYHAFRHRASTTRPKGVGRVTKFVEVGKGIWFPSKARVTAYLDASLKKGAKAKLEWTRDFHVDKFTLHPKHPATWFRDLEIEKNDLVYELDASGKIVKSYAHGAPNDEK